MTSDTIRGLRRLNEAASGGTWTPHKTRTGSQPSIKAEGHTLLFSALPRKDRSKQQAEKDMELICALRNNAESLIAAAERVEVLEKHLEIAKGSIAKLVNTRDFMRDTLD